MKLCKTVTISLLAAILSLPAYALTLNEAMDSLRQAKASGVLGEQANGYLGVVSAEGNAAEVAKLINEARKQEYQKVAKQSSASLSEVEKMAGTKAQGKVPAGQYIQLNGQWKKK